MSGLIAVQKLTAMGYRFQVEGDALRYEWQGTGKPDPGQVRPLLALVKEHKPEVLAYLSRPAPPERILSCSECPWYRANPWTHYPESPAWCQHHMDHLLQDNPACIGYKNGEVPNPMKE
jgi:hypothetical protein